MHPATEKATAKKAGGVAYIPVKGVILSRMSIFDFLFGGGSTSPASRPFAASRPATTAAPDDPMPRPCGIVLCASRRMPGISRPTASNA